MSPVAILSWSKTAPVGYSPALRYPLDLVLCGRTAASGRDGHRRNDRGLPRPRVDPCANGFFSQRLAERGCLLSIIQGIPFFYRQFGDEYALPLEATIALEVRQVPSAPEDALDVGAAAKPRFTFRRATDDDISALGKFYHEAVNDLDIHSERDEAGWRYLLAPYTVPEAMSHQTWLVEDCVRETGARATGYVRVAEYHFGEELAIAEASALPLDAGLATLVFAKDLAGQRNEPGIRLNLPPRARPSEAGAGARGPRSGQLRLAVDDT